MATDRRRRQVARQVQETVARLLLFDMKDPRASFTTITLVEMNHDLTVATIHWSVMETKSKAKVASLLKHAGGFFRSEVARAVDLRVAPILEFKYDDGAERTERIESILRKVLPEESEDLPEEDPDPSRS